MAESPTSPETPASPESVGGFASPPEPALTLGSCARCGGSVDVRGRHMQIDGSSVLVYCSRDCASAPATPVAVELPPPSKWSPLMHLARATAALPLLLFTSGLPAAPHAQAFATTAAPLAVATATPTPPAAPQFGPAWPPSEVDWAREIASDAWIHPLDGPVRRMPIRDARVFGAERPGDRPGECRGGHCGVDLGGEVWGEPIHAAHDGIVDRVQRGPNDEHGGAYVSIAHRGGTIFTKYFHLAAIPRWIEPGVHVKMGEVIGLLGDTGVKHSRPHLHF
ncbi:MAG TPA: M23 family metallopeptidase, partial [Polyangia bacterium]|nr:M23 family metallopeptidase [Polyangia bacterium]